MKIIAFFTFTLCFSGAMYSQEIFPSLVGDELLDSLKVRYKTGTVLSYADARDTMYALIDNVNDTVYGVYSRHGLYLPEGVDPSQWLFMSGSSDGINAEHSWPTSKGATEGTNAHSDLHHLFPTRTLVNSDRADFPFCEIEDAVTDKWYFRDVVMTSIPASMIDSYSEGMQGWFEPREEWKGNTARAMFYFYTMYREQADAEDPNFFEQMRECLCNWHFQDPADAVELTRSQMVAEYQEGKENPFVLDCSIPERTYCADFAMSCLTPVREPQKEDLAFDLRYDPRERRLTVIFRSEDVSDPEISLYDIHGRRLLQRTLNGYGQGEIIHTLDLPSQLTAGIYIFQVTGHNENRLITGSGKFILP